MKAIRDAWNVVLAGNWNLAIFSPNWLSKNLFGSESITIEFPLVPGLPPRFTVEGIVILSSTDRVMLAPKMLTDEAIKRTEDMACKLLNLLPHTPISALGVNFGFLEKEPSDELLQHFVDRDEALLADAGFEILIRTFSRKLVYQGQHINLSTIVEPKEVKFDLNFHTDVQNAEQAQKSLTGKVLKHRATALQLLEQVYSLNLEDE
jgi:hypothetical protein